VVPAYLVPYGVATLFYGLLADRLGRRPVLFASLLAFILLTALTASSRSASELILWRLLTGLGASGVVPLALTLMGDHFPFEQRGRPLGWLFGAMAGGAAFGSTVGVLLEPFIGWQTLFLGVTLAAVVVLGLLLPYRSLLGSRTEGPLPPLRSVLSGYRALLAPGRGLRTHGYVLWNGIFHLGDFTWLGLYFAQRYGLGEVGIGLAILGYGVPGFLLGPLIGRAADRWGRRWRLPAGLGIGAMAALLLVLDLPLLGAALTVTALSLSYDMRQPLLAGIVTALGRNRRGGQAMGLNVFMLFVGFGLGSYLFGELLRLGFSVALGVFVAVQTLLTLVAIPLFSSETRTSSEGA
jgi:predicted MFS family arabinose efflux permease